MSEFEVGDQVRFIGVKPDHVGDLLGTIEHHVLDNPYDRDFEWLVVWQPPYGMFVTRTDELEAVK